MILICMYNEELIEYNINMLVNLGWNKLESEHIVNIASIFADIGNKDFK